MTLIEQCKFTYNIWSDKVNSKYFANIPILTTGESLPTGFSIIK